MPIQLLNPLSIPKVPRQAGAHYCQLLEKGAVRVITGSRLHFGFLDLSPVSIKGWENRNNHAVLPIRRFGGVGLMLESPGISVQVQPSPKWDFSGSMSQVAQKHSQTLVEHFSSIHLAHFPCRVMVEKSAPHHVGLGTGTQLALAIGRALTICWGWDMPTLELAVVLGRGKRSAVGVHGFDHGGLIVEAGKKEGEAISPMIGSYPWPTEWKVELSNLESAPGVHGKQEVDAFEKILAGQVPSHVLGDNARNVLMGLLPALLRVDLEAFQAFVVDMNHRTGMIFDPLDQKKTPDENRGLGEHWCQSSWGPAKFRFFKVTG